MDKSANVYLTGNISDNDAFERGFFVAKYNGGGELIWAKGGIGAQGEDIAVNRAGDILVFGYPASSVVTLGRGQENETTLQVPPEKRSSFLARYDNAGELEWARLVTHSHSFAMDELGNSYATGYFMNTHTFGIGELNETALTSVGADDVFVAKYDSKGSLVWAQRAGAVPGLMEV